MFSLEKHAARVTAVTIRAENHGEETVNAVTVKIETVVPNDALSEFDPFLKGALFRRPDGDTLLPPGELPIPRFPLLGAVPWGYDGLGYTASIEQADDLFGHPPIVLEDVHLTAFRFECLDNGRVSMTFNIAARPRAADFGSLCLLLKRDVMLTLDEPEASELGQAA